MIQNAAEYLKAQQEAVVLELKIRRLMRRWIGDGCVGDSVHPVARQIRDGRACWAGLKRQMQEYEKTLYLKLEKACRNHYKVCGGFPLNQPWPEQGQGTLNELHDALKALDELKEAGQ